MPNILSFEPLKKENLMLFLSYVETVGAKEEVELEERRYQEEVVDD